MSYLAHTISSSGQNDALIKLKSLVFKKEVITTVEGLDALSVLGFCESCRSTRKRKEFLAEITPELIKSASANCPHQSTLDNLGRKIACKWSLTKAEKKQST